MRNGNPGNKKFAVAFIIVFIFLGTAIFFSRAPANYTFAETTESEGGSSVEKQFNDSIDDILGDIDSSDLDEFIENDFGLDFFNTSSFSKLVRSILSGKYFEEYDSLFSGVVSIIKENFRSILTFVFGVFAIVVIYQVFNNFCPDKYGDVKKVVRVIFTILIAIMILSVSKNLSSAVYRTISRLFDFSKVLFPILLSLILISGSNGTYTVYSSLSAFLLQTGAYIFVYILFPIVICILTITVVSCVFSSDRLGKVTSVLKSVFKYIIIAYFAVFGIFSSINIVSSGLSDGVNYKLTKFAIKSYIPVLGGYLSDGFDFIHSCSVVIKNSFGICGILVIALMIIKPIVLCVITSIMFKILSALVSFVGGGDISDYFEKVSGAITYFTAVIVGVFMCLFVFIYLLIISVSVM